MATLYKDIAALKDRGLLDPGRNRQGYHLEGAGFSHDELQVLLNGLRIQAEDLANPQARALYDKLLRRAGPSRREQAFYSLPVEAIAHVTTQRPQADPNAGQLAVLAGYVHQAFHEEAFDPQRYRAKQRVVE